MGIGWASPELPQRGIIVLRKRLFQSALALVMLGAAVVLPQARALATVGEVYGPYFLVDLHSGKCADDPNSSTSNNTAIIIYSCLAGANQKWDDEPPVTDPDSSRG
jgi:hypothetical protein